MKPEKRSGIPQADELVRAARVPVFLIDEHQGVRPYEIGTVTAIEQAAARNGAVIQKIDLDGQFRCGGSEAYIRWVETPARAAAGRPAALARAMTASSCCSPRPRSAWKTNCRPGSATGTWHGSPPGSAGRGAIPARTAPWSRT